MKRRVVITGMGAVTPIGNTVGELWQSVRAGRCGIGEITLFDPACVPVKLAGEVKELDLEGCLSKRDARKMDRYAQFAVKAAWEAFQMSGLALAEEERERFGVILSSGVGGLATIEAEHSRGLEKGFDRISPYYIPMVISNMGAAETAMKLGFHGPCKSVVTACASGTDAIGDSFRLIRDGYADGMLCGGAEASITPTAIGGFASMRALHTGTDANRASIPFDRERSGFVMGEGAGVLLLEEYEHAKARGARILGEIVGYGVNCDAYHMTAPHPEGAGAAACMKAAMADAGVRPDQIGYINAHGTSTPMNDACETKAVKQAFGEAARRLKMSSTKAMTGHLLGASGGVEAIITAMAVKDGYLPATIHYQMPDEACDLDILPNEGCQKQVTYAMSNSLGFGGHNASLIFRRWEE